MAEDLKWIRSSYSTGGGNGGGNCVEVAGLGGRRAVRDSKDPDGPLRVFSNASWTSFVAAVKHGRFDLT